MAINAGEAPAIPKLVFTRPTKDAPGFLRRMQNASKVQRAFENGDIEPITEFFLDYETAHPRDEAREILLNLSETEFNEILQSLMEAFAGKANSPAAQSNGKSTGRSAPARGHKRTGP